jgi:hypothetical protein
MTAATVHELVDELNLLVSVECIIGHHLSALWFDTDCWSVKHKPHRLEHHCHQLCDSAATEEC